MLTALDDGCCNAINEAMACGLPVISSDLPFNWAVLNDENAIVIDPLNIQQMDDAIIELRDNPKRRLQISNTALLTANYLTIDIKAKNIRFN